MKSVNHDGRFLGGDQSSNVQRAEQLLVFMLFLSIGDNSTVLQGIQFVECHEANIKNLCVFYSDHWFKCNKLCLTYLTFNLR